MLEHIQIIPLRWSYWRIITAIERKSELAAIIAITIFGVGTGFGLSSLALYVHPVFWIPLGLYFFWVFCSEYTSVYREEKLLAESQQKPIAS